jgi:hypothetical protein
MDMVSTAEVKKIIIEELHGIKSVAVHVNVLTFAEAIEKVQIQRGESYTTEQIKQAWQHWQEEHRGY